MKMKKIYRFRFSHVILALALLVAGPLAAGWSDSDQDAVSAIRQIWVNYAAYVETGDAAAWLSQYDAEGIQMRPESPARGRPDLDTFVVASWKARMDAFDTKMSISPLEIVVAGSWAYSRGNYTQDLKAKATGKTMHGDGKFLTVLKQQDDGSWRIFRDCFNSNVPPK
jgi:ketosteroid isomerase-like protein